MQASAASIAIVLAALHSGLISFDIAVAMVIGANVGTTITILLGSVGGIQVKKRVAYSHLIFNIVTGIVALLGIGFMVWLIRIFMNIEANSVMALAMFHTLFNVIGVIIFLPFIGILSLALLKVFPDRKEILTVFINNTPIEVSDAATAALKKEISHLLEECQLYNLRALHINEKQVFDHETPFEINKKKRYALDALYENIKLLHAEIFAFYTKLQSQKLEETETKELERVIFASRNIMNSIKNFKGIRQNLDEFDGSGNSYMNSQYKLFRKRLVELYQDMTRIFAEENKEEQYRMLLTAFVHIEEDDNRFIRETMKAVSEQRIQEMEISSLLLVNRLFTQGCRLQIFSMKDLLLTHDQVNDFDRAMDMKEIIDDERVRSQKVEVDDH